MDTTVTTIKQILVIEDNYADAQMIREVFGDLAHVQWHFVRSVVEARDFIANHPPYHLSPKPDLIILDISLPLSPGYLFIPEIKTNPDFRSTRVVVFTASESPRDRAMCAELGADAYIIKPIALADWANAVRSAIQDVVPEASPAARATPHG